MSWTDEVIPTLEIKDLRVCCDCLRDLSHLSPEQFDSEVYRYSDMSPGQKKIVGGPPKAMCLIDLYLCRHCAKTRHPYKGHF
jgi:hypothetical protein